MSYLVTIEGRNDTPLFLVDRRFIKDRWWSSQVDDAFQFRKRSAAVVQSKKLIFKNPGVISYEEARRIEAPLDFEEHPFSPDGHGQE